MQQRAPILCFGEVLWDRFPQGMLPGGAPVNVAYHLARHGNAVIPVTAVGDDELGARLMGQMNEWKLDTRFVSVVQTKPTGVVDVTLQPDGSASYHIAEDVAWDWIDTSSALLQTARDAAALCFGTLAARFDHNREKLALLLAAGENAFKAYDVNLRPPYDEHRLVWELARRADLIKLNDAELLALVGGASDDLHVLAIDFARKSNCRRVCVTAGARGAGLLADNVWHWADGRPVAARDTVGAGDAFLASLIDGMLREKDDGEALTRVLARACRVGEFVAASSGATPRYRISDDGVLLPPASDI
ncbi:MAG: carbohydrate kinase [Pyrinomonadaceae bacterium]